MFFADDFPWAQTSRKRKEDKGASMREIENAPKVTMGISLTRQINPVL